MIAKTRAVTAAHGFAGFGHAQMDSMALFGHVVTADGRRRWPTGRPGTLAMAPAVTRTEVALGLVDARAGSVAVRPESAALGALGVR